MKISRETKVLLTKNNRLQSALHRPKVFLANLGNKSWLFWESQESYILCWKCKVS